MTELDDALETRPAAQREADLFARLPAVLRKALAALRPAPTKLSGNVELVAVGSLPNDGKVIVDERR